MSNPRHYLCPYCNHHVTLREEGDDYILDEKTFMIQEPVEGHKCLVWYYVVCQNPDCRKFSLSVFLYDYKIYQGRYMRTAFIRKWDLVPPSKAMVFPDYIPKAILDDYNEACIIADLSPKASATLARRCLQGILRDFWKVKPGNLANEIDQIKEKTDTLTWEAIDSVRKVGNIGAHMEKDIDLIIDVDPKEAKLLLNLIEILLKEWYVMREERRNQLIQIKAIADQKDEAKKDGSQQTGEEAVDAASDDSPPEPPDSQ